MFDHVANIVKRFGQARPHHLSWQRKIHLDPNVLLPLVARFHPHNNGLIAALGRPAPQFKQHNGLYGLVREPEQDDVGPL
jgi:hypothetical protein